MSSSRDDFSIAFRSALLQKGAAQRFSLVFLIVFALIIFFLDINNFSFIKPIRSIINDGIYRVSLVVSSPSRFIPQAASGATSFLNVKKENQKLKEELEDYKQKELNVEFLYNQNKNLKKILESEESYLKNLIENKFVDKGDYETVLEYENEISRITSNFKIFPNVNNFGSSWKIESKISNLENWKNILSLIEKNTNLSVQNYLQDNFKNSIAYHKKLNEYMFENFMIEINKKKRIIDDKEIISHINTVLESKMENKNFDRLETLFKLTPLAKDKFYAAKISLSSSNYEKIGKEISKKSLIFIAGFIGLMLGMIYVLISDKFLKKS